MSKNFHILPIKLAAGQIFDKATNTLTLKEAGIFKFTIKEYQEEYDVLNEKFKKKSGNLVFQDQFNKSLKPGSEAYIDYQKKKAIATKEIEAIKKQRDSLNQKFADLQWCWQLYGNGFYDQGTISHNKKFGKGLTDFVTDVNGNKAYNQINFSKLLEGGGYVWLEAFTDEDKATGKPPYGIFVKAMGTPKVIRTEWTDFDFKPITQTIGFGSKVLLNIYTQGLYGQELEIDLIDDDAIKNDILAERIITEVNSYKINPNEIGKAGIDGTVTNKTKTEVQEQRIQKAVVEVTINPMWIARAGRTFKHICYHYQRANSRSFKGGNN